MRVTLDLPSTYLDLFQLTGELLTEEGQVVAKTSRTHLARPKSELLTLGRWRGGWGAQVLGF